MHDFLWISVSVYIYGSIFSAQHGARKYFFWIDNNLKWMFGDPSSHFWRGRSSFHMWCKSRAIFLKQLGMRQKSLRSTVVDGLCKAFGKWSKRVLRQKVLRTLLKKTVLEWLESHCKYGIEQKKLPIDKPVYYSSHIFSKRLDSTDIFQVTKFWLVIWVEPFSQSPQTPVETSSWSNPKAKTIKNGKNNILVKFVDSALTRSWNQWLEVTQQFS